MPSAPKDARGRGGLSDRDAQNGYNLGEPIMPK